MSRYEKITLEKFNDLVQDHEASLTDVKTNLKETRYEAGGVITATQDTPLGKLIMKGKLNDNGFNGMCERIGAPGRWLKSHKCPPDLEQTIVHRLNEDQVKNSLIRYRQAGGNDDQLIRAVLSDQYLPYNHLDMWQDIKNAIVGTKLEGLDPKIWKPYISEAMDAWILFEGVVADPEGYNPKLYDGGGAGGLKPAIHIRNSEDGQGKVRIDSGFYRSYCTNGVIFGLNERASLSAIHRGKSKHFMRANVAMAVAGAARACGLGINKFIKATTIEIKTNVIDKVVDEWTSSYHIAVGTKENWTKSLTSVRTWADLVMATSDFAGTLQDRNESTQFEELSGELLFAPINQEYRL